MKRYSVRSCADACLRPDTCFWPRAEGDWPGYVWLVAVPGAFLRFKASTTDQYREPTYASIGSGRRSWG